MTTGSSSDHKIIWFSLMLVSLLQIGTAVYIRKKIDDAVHIIQSNQYIELQKTDSVERIVGELEKHQEKLTPAK